jgi:hypothetical protein
MEEAEQEQTLLQTLEEIAQHYQFLLQVVGVEQAATHLTQPQLAMGGLEAELDGIQAEAAEELLKLVLIAQM